MAGRATTRTAAGAVLVLSAVLAGCRRAGPPARATSSAAIVRPGAPGQDSKVLTAATVGTPPPPSQAANAEFMQGMIQHHEQALAMVALLRERTTSPQMRLLAKKIEISQTQEIKTMQDWLARRDQALPAALPNGTVQLEGRTMSLMPGMLTPQQMMALGNATGRSFDRLFLSDMIQHHTGALTMVDQLFATPGAGEDPELFALASDIDSTQRVEIARMRAMLEGMP